MVNAFRGMVINRHDDCGFVLKKTLCWSYVSRAMFVCRLVFRLMENQIKIFITTKYHQMTAIKGIVKDSLGCITELRTARIYQPLFHAAMLRVLSSCLCNVIISYHI